MARTSLTNFEQKLKKILFLSKLNVSFELKKQKIILFSDVIILSLHDKTKIVRSD